MEGFKSIADIYDYIEREARKRVEEILRKRVYGRKNEPNSPA